MANCTKCGKYLSLCKCVDAPPKEVDFFYYFNRTCEEWARWLRALGFLVLTFALIFIGKAYGTNLDGKWDNSPYQEWYKKQTPTPQTLKMYEIKWVSCCNVGDVCQRCVVHRYSNHPPWKDGWYYEKDGVLTQLPNHIVEYVPWTPTGKPVLFIAPFNSGKMKAGEPICLKVPGGAT